MKKNVVFKRDDFEVRLINTNDKDEYFNNCVNSMDKEVDYFTGTTGSFTKEQIDNYIDKIVNDESRYDFMIIEDNRIIGEVVINEIDYKESTAHYRIAMFSKSNFNRGIGFKSSKMVIDFISDELNIDEITLEVYPFNERGIWVYKKLGFEYIRTFIDDEASSETYKDVIEMKYYSKKKKVLVMGGSYFIGKKVVDELLEKDYIVYTLNRGSKEPHDNRIINLKSDRNIELKMKELLKDYTFDIVVDISGLNKYQMKILNESLNKEKLTHFVFISSSAVYDLFSNEIPFKEEDIIDETRYWGDYSTNKILSEEYLVNEFENSDTTLIVLRPPYVYGAENYVSRETFAFEHIENDIPIIVPGDGERVIQFVHTIDISKMITKLLTVKLPSINLLNIGNKKGVSHNEWIRLCEKVVGKKAKVYKFDYKDSEYKTSDFFPFIDYDNVLDVTKLNMYYSDEVDMLAGLKDAYEWYQVNRETIKYSDEIRVNEKKIIDIINGE